MTQNKEYIFPTNMKDLALTRYSIKRFVFRFALEKSQRKKQSKSNTTPKPTKISLQEAITLVLDHSQVPMTLNCRGKKGKLQAAHLLVGEFLGFLKSFPKSSVERHA